MIVRNEEKMLPDCLQSVKDYVMEIIIVDTGSTDRTKEIAEEYGCRIIDFSWQDDFAMARNVALDNCTQPFILSIDADERLINPIILSKLCLNSPLLAGGWLVHLISEAVRPDGAIDKFVTNLLRFFRNDPRIRFRGIIHEQIHYSILDLGMQIQNSPLEFIHLGYSSDKNDMPTKQLRNLKLLNKVIQKNPDSYNYFQRGKTYLALNELQKADSDLAEAMKLIDNNNVLLPQILNFGALVATRLGLKDIAKQRAEMSLKIIPKQAFAYFVLAELYFEANIFKEALDNYLKLDEMQTTQDLHAMIAGDYRMPSAELAYKIGKCYLELKDFESSERFFIIGNQFNPRDINILAGLANIYFLNGNFVASLEKLNLALSYDPTNLSIQNYITLVKSKLISLPSTNISNPVSVTKPLFSLSMIVKNEESMLPDCLESVKNLVDEIIIIDTGSSDNTLNVAKSFGAKIFHYDWNDDFASARNESLKHCSGEWILYLDADERLEPFSVKNLRSILENTSEDIGGYVCTIESAHLQLDNSTELHRGGYPRIFRNYGYPNIKFEGRVHEQIGASIFALDKSIAFSEVIIKHLGYDTTRDVMQGKVKRNYQLLLKHINEEPTNAYAWFQLGQTLAQMQLVDESEKAIRFSIEVGSLSDAVYASACATLSQIVGGKRNFTEALNWAEKSLEKAPEQVFALSLKGFALLLLNRKAEAEQVFLTAISRNKSHKSIPQTGFDVQVPENELLEGLQRSRN
jgi:glycosyltransferase involved in cell wall biosynthesis